MSDYFYQNTKNFNIGTTEKVYAKFCVKGGNTVDFNLYLASNTTDSVTIKLKKNGNVVATANLTTDSRFRGLIWREKIVEKMDSVFEVTFTNTSKGTGLVLANSFQWSFKT